MNLDTYLSNMMDCLIPPKHCDYVDYETINVKKKVDKDNFKINEKEPSYLAVWFYDYEDNKDCLAIYSLEKTEKSFKRKKIEFVKEGSVEFEKWFDKITKNRELL